jgi:hypothetical protein
MSFKSISAAFCGFVALSVGVMPVGARAADVTSHAPSAKRQLILCMTKRMSDSRSLSYNEATKLCKEQLAAQRVTLTTSVLAKPMAP